MALNSHVVAARTGGFPENKAKELSQHCDSRACALRVEIIPQREIVPHAAGAPLRGGAVWTTIERGFGFMKGTEFSPRERQIVDAVLQAKSVKDIAADLDLSVNTVKDYLKVIYRKAMVHSARELMRRLMPGGRPAPAADHALVQLLHAAQGLAASTSPSAAQAQLAAAVRRCSRAQRVAYGRWVCPTGDLYLALDQPAVLVRAGEFAHRLRDRGWARLESPDPRSPEARQLQRAGLGGELIGVALNASGRAQVLLAASDKESFGPLDLSTIRLLAQLARFGPHPHPLPAVETLAATA